MILILRNQSQYVVMKDNMAIKFSKGLLGVGLLLRLCIRRVSGCLVSGALGLLGGGSGRRDLGEDVENDHNADVDQTHYEDSFGLDLEPCAVFREVPHVP